MGGGIGVLGGGAMAGDWGADCPILGVPTSWGLGKAVGNGVAGCVCEGASAKRCPGEGCCQWGGLSCEEAHSCGVQPADRGDDILGAHVPIRDFGDVLGCGVQGESGSGEGVPGIWVPPLGGHPVRWVWVSPLRAGGEVGEVPGDLGCRGATAESGFKNQDALGIQVSLVPRTSPQQWRVQVPQGSGVPARHIAWPGQASRGAEGRGC